MASTGINWANFVVNNDGIKDFRELINLSTIEGGDFGQFHTFNPNTHSGDKLDGIGAFAEVGLAGGTSCAPTFNSSQARSVEKTWVLGEWEVAEKICYKDLDTTAARYGLNQGTEIADVVGTVITRILEPKVSDAIKRMYWRLGWFGDTAAANIAGGGVITAGKNANLFTACDGFFKKFAALIAADPLRNTDIAANAQATYALQNSAFTNGIDVLDAMIYSAPLALRSAAGTLVPEANSQPTSDGVTQNMVPGAFILCTQSVADAYEKQLTGTGTVYTQIQWETGMLGMKKFQRKGVDIYPIALWDSYIQEYENNGTKWNNPHRAVFTTIGNLHFAAPNTELVTNLDVWFSKDDQDTKMLARDRFGVLILDDTLFQYAV